MILPTPLARPPSRGAAAAAGVTLLAVALSACTPSGPMPVRSSATAAMAPRPPAAASTTSPTPRAASTSLLEGLALDDQRRLAGLFVRPGPNLHAYQPPAYADPSRIEQRELSVGAAPWTLPATLTLPAGASRCPALVLVHGSGPNDRDETIGPNKPFADLALGLAARGVCVLRYEKRTKHFPQQTQQQLGEQLTLAAETVDDAVAAVALLRHTSSIDPARVFVLGHSLGGTAIPRIARRAPKARGFILMAGSSLPLEDTILRQMRYVTGLDSNLGKEEHKILVALEKQVARVKALRPGSRVATSELPLSIPAAYWLDLAAHPPAREIASERRPLLVLQGDRDYQVVGADFQRWQQALARHPDATFKRYRALNHLFMSGSGASSPTEYNQPGHVAAEVIDDVARWIAAH